MLAMRIIATIANLILFAGLLAKEKDGTGQTIGAFCWAFTNITLWVV